MSKYGLSITMKTPPAYRTDLNCHVRYITRFQPRHNYEACANFNADLQANSAAYRMWLRWRGTKFEVRTVSQMEIGKP